MDRPTGGQKATLLVCKYVDRRFAREIVRDVESNRGTVDHIGINEESRDSNELNLGISTGGNPILYLI